MQFQTVAEAIREVGGLSNPSKMPTRSWSIPASRCQVGSKLREVPGSACFDCYACKGAYCWRSTVAALARRWDRLQDALECPVSRARFVGAFTRILANRDWWRWHDSGDVQSVDHLDILVDIAKGSPHCRFWLPTREYGIVAAWRKVHGEFPSNLVVRLSAHMQDKRGPDVGLPTSTIHSEGPAIGTECPAYQNDGECGDCRMCWSADVSNVSYPLH